MPVRYSKPLHETKKTAIETLAAEGKDIRTIAETTQLPFNRVRLFLKSKGIKAKMGRIQPQSYFDTQKNWLI